jgi:uncharacterized protein YdhG (YjbR/CyaY superfamily)
MKQVKDVDENIALSPKGLQYKLKELREIIKLAAPKAQEHISYGMAYYHYKGRLVYFGLSKKHIGLYIPTPIIEEHKSGRATKLPKQLFVFLWTKTSCHANKKAS